MTKEFQKAICTRSRLKNKMNNNSEIKNITAYKRQRNLCLSKKEKCKIFPQKRFKKGNYYKQKLLDFHQFIPNKQRFL